jgi:tetratricopeptide (TPR) repeat protein
VLLQYRSPLPIPVQTPPQPGWQAAKPAAELSAEEVYLKALTFDKQTDRPQARAWYEKALALDAEYAPALKGLAVLDLEAGQYSAAEKNLTLALVRNPDDGAAWFFLATAQDRLGQDEAALTSAYRAVRTLSQAAVGYDLAGRIYMRRGQYEEALPAFEKSLSHHPDDERTREHLLLAHFALGHESEALRLARLAAETDPTRPLPGLLLGLLEARHLEDVCRELSSRLGEDEFELVEAALVFAEVGLYEPARQVLQAAVEAVEGVAAGPLPYIFLAEWSNQLGNQQACEEYIQRSEACEGEGIFPSRLEALPALEHAVRCADAKGMKSARTRLRLGNLYGGLGRMEEARQCWQQAAAADGSLNVAWRNLGLLAWKQDHDLDGAESSYRRALSACAEDQTLYRDLSQILLERNRRPEAIALLESMENVSAIDNLRADIVEILAQAYLDENDYDRAIARLNDSFFSNWENRTVSRNIFARAHLERGKARLQAGDVENALADFDAALSYPDNLGVGRPAHPAEAEPFFWKGEALAALHRSDEAKAAWRQGAESHPEEYRQRCREKLEE